MKHLVLLSPSQTPMNPWVAIEFLADWGAVPMSLVVVVVVDVVVVVMVVFVVGVVVFPTC